jgi:predicted hydrocarbon binding protein
MEEQRKYKFDWDSSIGADMASARPNLGPNIRIEVYRLFQFTLRDILEQNYGTEKTDTLFREAGFMAGNAFYQKYLGDAKDTAGFLHKTQDYFNRVGKGILRVETAEEDNSHFILTVDEDLDCSGLPDMDDVICVYDEGFFKGLLESFSGKKYDVKETDCWCTNARTCRYEAKVI